MSRIRWPQSIGILPALALALGGLLVVAAIGWPAWSIARVCIDPAATATLPEATLPEATLPEATLPEATLESSVNILLLRSIGYAFGAALLGVLIAWPASRAYRRNPSSLGNRIASGVVLLPIALPPWLLYAAMWMSTGPGTLVGDFCERADLVGELRKTLLVIALVDWCAALSFAVLVCSGPRELVRDGRLLALDRAGFVRRARAALARDGRSLLVALLACASFLLCETTAFDLAQISTYGFELRTLDALGAAPATVVRAALPAIAIVLAIVLTMVVLLPAISRATGDAALRSRSDGSAVTRSRAAPALLLVGLPTAIVVLALARVVLAVPRAGDFLALHGRALATTLLVATAVALLIGALGACIRLLLSARARALRIAARALAIACIMSGFMPATITAISIVAAYNSPVLGFIYDSPLAIVLVLTARVAPVAGIVAIALAAREPRTAARLRALDGDSVLAVWRGIRNELAIASAASATLAFAWSLSELTASGRVVPPGLAWIATDILNAIHYQRPDTVILATGGLLLAALPALWMLTRLMRRLQGASALLLAIGASVSLIMISGCDRASDDRAAAAAASTTTAATTDDRVMSALRSATPFVSESLSIETEFAGVGRGRGQFNAPRVVAYDDRNPISSSVGRFPFDGSTYVIDKDARVQRFLPSGEVVAEWRLPKTDRGKPVGATVAPDGSLVVADTHEHRIVCYSPSGELLWMLGGYGKGRGEFIYPTDIAFLPDGRMLIAEYGGNDRIQAFGPDRAFMYEFGHCGTGEGEFLRPQAMAYDAERDELYVADAGNHRIEVFTSDGEFRRSVGRPGLGAGEFSYPFGVVLEIGDRAVDSLGVAHPSVIDPQARRTLVVVEHSNHRLQWIDAQSGESLGIAGGLGTENGRLKYPWSIVAAGLSQSGAQRFAVCDNGNSRIVFFALPKSWLGERQRKTDAAD